MNIDMIKKSFFENYKHFPEIAPQNTLIHKIFNGCRIHTRSGIKTLIKILKPKNILEIGSLHFETTNQMALSMAELFPADVGKIHSFDIKTGGYDGARQCIPLSTRIVSHIWIPHKTSYDDWKYKDEEILKTGFADLTNEQIFEKNLTYLKSIAPTEGFDLVYIDGDHSFQGTMYDYQYAKQVINENSFIVVDDIWDNRLHEVREFFDSLKNDKWDFYEWNIAHKDMVQNMGIFKP